MKQTTGSEELDKFLEGGYEKGIITTIYGPAGSGKTNLAMLATIKEAEKNKVIYIDTEGGFSVERLRQLSNNPTKTLGNILFLKPTTFQELNKSIIKLEKQMNKKITLIVIDSIAGLYRTEQSKNHQEANKNLAEQVNTLVKISREYSISVLMTNQVYADVKMQGKLHLVGGDIVRYASKCLIELEKGEERKTLILKKHRHIEEKKQIDYEIIEKGIKLHNT